VPNHRTIMLSNHPTSRGGAASAPSLPQRCSRRSCGSFINVKKCVVKDCEKYVCWTCVDVKICQKRYLDTLKDGNDNIYVCNKKHYVKAKNSLLAAAVAAGGGDGGDGGGGRPRLPWNNDGPLGGDGSINSELILINWLCTEGNYLRYRSKDKNGLRKNVFCAEISRKMKEAGIRYERTAKQIQSKIDHIGKNFRKAYDWSKTETGKELQEKDVGTFRIAVERMCSFYFTLYDVFADGAAAKPMVRPDATKLDSSPTDDDEDSSNGSNTSENSSKRSSDGDVEALAATGAGEENTSLPVSRPTKRPRRQHEQRRPRTPPSDNSTLSNPSEIGGSYSRTEQQMDSSPRYQQATLNEMVRHNKEIEAIERTKAIQAAWDGKRKEMEYKCGLYREYLSLKNTMPEKRIAKIFPDMTQFFENDDDDADGT
jgi:hypothetical protein